MVSEKLFTTFNDRLIKCINITSKRKYYYVHDDETFDLEEKKVDELSNAPIYSLRDQYRKWVDLKKTQPYYFDLTINIQNLVHIFHGRDQVCYSNTILGVAVEWKPKNSKVKRCIKVGEISDYIEGDSITFNLNKIEVKYPDNDIDFNWIIYVAKPGKGNADGEHRFGNAKGLILGRGLLWTIVNGGNASMFPIDEVYKKDSPLWSIRCSFNDWCEDEFSQDNLAIILNQWHPLYKNIIYESDTYDPLVFKEVISSAFSSLIQQIILIAKDNNCYSDIEKENIEEKGSILAAIKYFKETKGLVVGGLPSDLLDSVKKMFDKEKGL